MAASSSTATSASASTSSDPNSNSSFDVFLNHHGGDVKKKFASHLYHRLHSYGPKVFLDQQESQRGDAFTSQIRGAIRAASVHVAIFSVRYAESAWCLNELLWMLESEAPIIPVFCHVKPDEVRWTLGKDGVYAKALLELEKKTNDDQTLRHDPAIVKKWREALHKVSLISGFELKECNDDEGILLNKVVESVLKIVKKPLHVAEDPKGLDEKIEEFEIKVLLPHLQSGRKPQIVGIVGLGGVGKTTLAKELYNRKTSQYSRCCFLDDVRENLGKGSLISLQSILLKKIGGTDLQIHSKHEATAMLKKHLSSQEILLVLDDVDSVSDQFQELVPDVTSIHSNSLILITSRDRDVLKGSGVEKSSIYELNGLNKQHSVELFCLHAFRRSYPLPEFEDLTEKFVNACNGLPLSLKVFGALLHGNSDISFWQMQLDKIGRILPREIQKRLRISYEALDSEEKEMFLDIACFFVGENRDTAIRIWNGSGWGGQLGFQTLQNRCLVEVAEGNRGSEIRMHDHRRDLGRAEAREARVSLRFWRIDDLLQQSYNEQAIPVRGIRMVLSEYSDDDEEDFDSIKMRRLQLVDAEGMLLERILRRVKSPDLIWLCWKECPYASLPSSIPMKKLRVLRVSGNTLKTLWQRESQAPKCLEELRVDGCQQLKSIHGLAQLRMLHRLDVSRCTELEELPNMETLVSLEEVWAEGCVKLKSMRGLEHATKLKQLNVDGCTELKELPDMETLVSLEELSASRCVKLKSIRGLEHTTKLKRLNVVGCTELDELPHMETLVSLEQLLARRWVKLKSIRGLEHATDLKWLRVDGCTELEELPNMETLVSLEVLWASRCGKLKSLRGLEHATKLKDLDVHWCVELEELPNMETLVSLEHLCVAGCTGLEELPNMETLISLRLLLAEDCVKLKNIRGLEHATKLQRLDVAGCTELEELPNMKKLVSLEELWARGCVKVKSIRGLESATKLRELNIDGCTELEELPNMETLVSLEVLRTKECVKLKSIQGLEHATKLKMLDVAGCTDLKEISDIETLVSLEFLGAEGCVKLKKIQGLEQVKKLKRLRFRVAGCTELQLQELPNMETLVPLKQKRIQELPNMETLVPLKQKRIEGVGAGGCMETLVPLKQKRIEGLVSRCPKSQCPELMESKNRGGGSQLG